MVEPKPGVLTLNGDRNSMVSDPDPDNRYSRGFRQGKQTNKPTKTGTFPRTIPKLPWQTYTDCVKSKLRFGNAPVTSKNARLWNTE